MIRKNMEKFLRGATENGQNEIRVSSEEKKYIEENNLMNDENISLLEEDQPFEEAYLELCDKESEEMVAEKKSEFLLQPISYFKQNMNEFIYVESGYFDRLGVDSVCFEVDDVFQTYEAMLGLKLQKKYDAAIRDYLTAQMDKEKGRFSLMFNANEGIWDLNMSLDGLPGFSETFTVHEAFMFIHSFMFRLMEAVESA